MKAPRKIVKRAVKKGPYPQAPRDLGGPQEDESVTPMAAAAQNRSSRRLQRDPEEVSALETLELAQRRSDERKAEAQNVKKNKRTPAHKTMHAVDNEGVHNGNSSERQVDSRTEVDREADHPRQWTRSSHLSAPSPRAGMSQKWVRYRGRSESGAEIQDTDNLEKHLDEGWRPRKRESVRRGHELTASPNDKYASCYVKRGLILMELPEELALQRRRHFRKIANRMTEGIDRNMFRINHPAMPFLDPARTTRVSTTARRGRLEDQEQAASDAD